MEQENLELYRKLQQHMNEQPVGFPPTSSGSDIRLLKYYFDPEEASIALALNYKNQSLSQIHDSFNKQYPEKDDLERILQRMTQKGIIRWKLIDGLSHYHILPLVVGLDESQNYNRSLEYIHLIVEYMMETRFPFKLVSSPVTQMRTIPVEKSIEVEHLVSNYDNINSIVQNIREPIVLLDCICRKTQNLLGNRCKQTSRLETCMAFDNLAKQWLRRGQGKSITKQEALEVLKQNQEDGLVLQPSNSKDPEFICSCCGCCCGILTAQKYLPNPAKFWASNYSVELDESSCKVCKTCLDFCQFDALKFLEKKNKLKINLKRCVGCGNCVVSCPNNALRLIQKAESSYTPKDTEELYELAKQ
ncbi:MAG: 4Fe-4S binding protein [Candidatus Lokiarchaeota archaeon]|nr:4Fe-4S binding protein [Candidatus Lokiarchaeota archaeon]